MTKHNTIFSLLQNFISPEDIADILQEYGSEDVARKCTVDKLLHYLVGATVFKRESISCFLSSTFYHFLKWAINTCYSNVSEMV